MNTEWTPVTLGELSVDQCLKLVAELKTYLTLDQDFEYSYRPTQRDWLGSVEEPSSVEFRFREATVAVMFALRYSNATWYFNSP